MNQTGPPTLTWKLRELKTCHLRPKVCQSTKQNPDFKDTRQKVQQNKCCDEASTCSPTVNKRFMP